MKYVNITEVTEATDKAVIQKVLLVIASHCHSKVLDVIKTNK
jgi:hypothetical protein